MSVTPIHVFAKWKVRPGQLENVLLILKKLKAKSIQEKGNLFYQVHQDSSDPNTLILFEGYSDDSALTLHRNAGYATSSSPPPARSAPFSRCWWEGFKRSKSPFRRPPRRFRVSGRADFRSDLPTRETSLAPEGQVNLLRPKKKVC